MSRFMTYLKERSPLPALSFLSAGIVVSALSIDQSYDWAIVIIGIVLNNLLLIQMRLGDELKDFETDKVINPTRPLPRGLFKPQEVFSFLKIFLGALIISSLLMVPKSPIAGAALIVASIFSWLMFKEFYMSHELDKSPMIYAISHQIIVFPLFAWPGLLQNPALIQNKIFLGWLLANFGCSFTFEVCRKLNPGAHAMAKTYAHYYGRTKTVLICLIFMSITAIGAWIAGIGVYSLASLGILLLSLIAWHQNPQKYKIPAGLSGLSSAVVLWSPAIIQWVQAWSSK
jgi:hypothetical protein